MNILSTICLRLPLFLVLGGVLAAAEPEVRLASTVRVDPRSGRLVRGTLAPRKPVAAPAAAKSTANPRPPAAPPAISELIEATAKAYEIDPLLVHSVIRVESNYNPFAVSGAGAQGIMQLIPATARRFGAVNSFDVRDNIAAGVKYLKYLQDRFKDDRLALAAYNAGEGAVQKFNNIPPYRETENYVNLVGKAYEEARGRLTADAALTAAAEPAAGPVVEPLRGLLVAYDNEGRLVLRTR